MDCNEARALLDADADGELDLVRHLELAEHLRSCAACRERAEAARARRTALRDTLPRFTAPQHLAGKIRTALAAEGMPADTTPPRRPTPFPRAIVGTIGLAASLTLAALGGFAWSHARARAGLLVTEAVNDHVRSLQADHLNDVASTDQHTVKPWFAGKLDFSPPVVDLTEAGFPLTGGRLEHIDGRPAAAIVFHRRQHAINLFVWPASNGALGPRQSAQQGYNTESWSQGGLNYLAVSEIPAGELANFVAAFRRSIP
ncbi:MAG TPA: zf-HC2 domain-containing protein [Candidatus Didemnitutus sp.]|nr:zf-HC2 domain-containing protein [Candidatus Didemnitutus sp.]